MSTRKKFLKALALGTVSLPVVLRTIVGSEQSRAQQSGPAIRTNKTYKWKMVTTWPPNFPILGEACNQLAELVNTMSNGRLQIEVFGGGTLVPPLECFDTVRTNAAQIASGVSYYWAGKAPAAQFFASIPFGLNAQQHNAWLLAGGGLELWRELYADFNLVPFAGGNTGVQMGGWFNREINSVTDFRGLKIRMPGLGGRVVEQLGGSPVLLAGGEIYTGLERGVIDATEWIGPYHDYLMGFHEIARYYYYPGWHEPGTNLEFFVNRQAFEALPADLQTIVEMATSHLNIWTLSAIEAQNAIHLRKIQATPGLEIRPFPKAVLDRLWADSVAVVEDFAQQDPFAGKVYASFQTFRKRAVTWSEITESVYYESLQRLPS